MILIIYVGDEECVWNIWGGNWCVIDNEVSGLCNVYEKKKKMFDVVIKFFLWYWLDVYKLKIIFFI